MKEKKAEGSRGQTLPAFIHPSSLIPHPFVEATFTDPGASYCRPVMALMERAKMVHCKEIQRVHGFVPGGREKG
jgi:hypothetical protein